ncbi:MAG: energy-coupling factor ABC transporter ATP-binding protein [Clostridia bacterium]|nr:energy-coupling factor ABC transporter ATP-binding protein [Clostridia bacterium]
MDSTQSVFELNNICFSYPYEKPVLDNISLNVKAGEKICILGANGSGKSTFLKILLGLLHPQKGSFKAFGTQMTSKLFSDSTFSKDYHRRVGFIFQNSEAQLFCSTVKEEIAFGPLQLNLPTEQVRQRMEDVLNLLNIQHLKDKTPFKLSGGEKKKVALASVLVLNPEVLILDEPTNGLDPKTQRWLVELLIGLNRAGKTIITSTHNLELVQEISNRAVVFDETHKIAADGATQKVLEDVEFLKRVNLVDEYYHRHGDAHHAHYHIHNY